MKINRHLTALALTICFVAVAQGEVFNISAIVNTAQEIPAPSGAADSAAGFAALQYDDVTKELSWDIAWQDLTGPAVGMHFHSPALAGSTAGVAVNVGGISGLSSPSVGSAVITDDFASSLLAGQSYLNIHTAANGPGEIRGQVNPSNINLMAMLDTAQEIPAPSGVSADAGGVAHIAFDPVTNLLGWNISWENLTGPAIGMHFHGAAGFGETAGVQLNVGEISGLSSPSIGSAVISDEFEGQLLAGQWYLNIHTAANGPGEIRGQVVPEPSSAMLAMLSVLGLMGVARRRR